MAGIARVYCLETSRIVAPVLICQDSLHEMNGRTRLKQHQSVKEILFPIFPKNIHQPGSPCWPQYLRRTTLGCGRGKVKYLMLYRLRLRSSCHWKGWTFTPSPARMLRTDNHGYPMLVQISIQVPANGVKS